MKVSIIENMKYSISKISIDLKKEWFCTSSFSDFDYFKNTYLFDSDLYIIDASVCHSSCFSIVKWLKLKKSNTPIIVIYWSIVLDNIVNWYNLWIDDYLVKPYFKEELYASIRLLIRKKHSVIKPTLSISYNTIFDINNRVFIKEGRIIKLTSREIKLAEFFIYNIWELVTKIQLINSVWWEYDPLKVTDNNINVILSNVRKKLWAWFGLKTIVNVWYILESFKD